MCEVKKQCEMSLQISILYSLLHVLETVGQKTLEMLDMLLTHNNLHEVYYIVTIPNIT